MLGIRRTHFILTDGSAALLSVPTQVFFFAYYGGEIIATIGVIKKYFLIALLTGAAVFILVKLKKTKNKH